MLRVPDRPLPRPAAERLRDYQREIDAIPGYRERIAEAKQKFGTRNRASNPTFRAVRETLQAMCGATGRCMYCEDSMADEVEHFRPKDLYPEAVFVWINLLHVCGPCNGSKGSRYYVFAASDGQMVDVTRAAGTEMTPPTPGDPVLIHPRQDDPLELLELDLRGTFRFRPRARPGTRAHERAARTIEVLKLNGREVLLEARRVAFESLLALLQRFVDMKVAGASSETLDRIRSAIASQPHPVVWTEMKRQRQKLRLDRLFERSPEALEW